MTRILSNLAAATATVMAFIITIGLVMAASSAQARPNYMKLEGVTGEVQSTAKPQRGFTSAGRTVCCSVPRKKALALVPLSLCRKAKGKVVPKPKCALASKASEAYFVKVDRDTTTQNRRPVQRGPSSVRPK